MPALTMYTTNTSFIGVAAEAVVGTAVAATNWLQATEIDADTDPGVIVQKLMRRSRASAFVPVQGEAKPTLKVTTPLYYDQGLLFLTALAGTDTYQSNGASSGGQALSAIAAAGASSISLGSQTTPAIAANDYVEIRVGTGAAGDSNLSEIHKVSGVSGTGPYTVTFAAGETLRNAYTTSSQAYRIAGSTTAFTHYLHPDQPNSNTYKTLTVEVNRAGMDSRQFFGTTVNKGSFKFTTKDLVLATYDLLPLGEQAVSPSTPVFGTSAPVAPAAQLTCSLFGSSDTSIKTLDLDIDQGAKQEWTFNGSNFPFAALPLERKISGKWTNLVQSGTYYTTAQSLTTGAAVFTLTSGANSIAVTLPKFQIMQPKQPLKVGALWYYEMSWQADFDDVTGRDVEIKVTSGLYLPFI